MSRRFRFRAVLSYALFAVLVAISSSSSTAQVPSAPKTPAQERVPAPPKRPDDRITLPPKPPEQERVPAPPKGPTETPPVPPAERRLGRVSLPVTRGVQLRVDNRTTGRITVHGWERDVIEARATSERGEEVLILQQSADDEPKRISLKADYANTESGAAATTALEFPPLSSDGPIQVNLEVNVPRHVGLELIRVTRSEVEITGIETPVGVIGHSSNVTMKDVGSAEAHTRTGSIVIENARGISDVSSSTGRIRITNSRGAVRAVSITGPIEISCAKGRIDVGNTQAPIQLNGIDGDVEAIAASSDVSFKGPLSDDNRYYLKSMSGRVEMIIPSDTRGFNATLTSYRGTVESDFSLHSNASARDNEHANHRLSGRFGNGSTQITLDSFQGLVKLTKVARNSIEPCK